MKAAVMYKVKDIRIEERPKPLVKPGFALVKIKAVGICGSDVHYYIKGKIGSQIVKNPIVLGHEASGIVEEIGKGVKNLKVGDKVALEPGIFCGKCDFCRAKRPNLCRSIKFFGTPPVDGAFLEYIVHPAAMLFKLPKKISYEEGALLEPLTVGMYAVELSGIKHGETAAILGCGTIGLCILKSALAAGAKHIYITDYLNYRLKLAKKNKNVTVINAKNNPVEKIKRLTNGRGVDVVFEAAGSPAAFKQTVEIAATGGRVVWAGIPEEDYIKINNHEARRKELVIKTVRRTKHQNEKAVKALASGKIKVKDLATNIFALKDISKAFQIAHKYKNGVIKAIIKF
ncbi:MAG: NAD(P)-dependent alcohol dehydrogenase [Candidatus Firestonebacteria bacterium]